MPKKTKINNEQVISKVNDFVSKANEKQNETSDEDDTNIYIESIVSQTSNTESKPRREKKPRVKKAVVTPVSLQHPNDSEDKYFKMFNEYKNELTELKNIIKSREGHGTGLTQATPTQIAPPSIVDTRREMMKLRFG
jgi:hypothetical protein